MSAWFAEYKVVVYAITVLFLVLAFGIYTCRVEQRGEDKVNAKNAELVAAQVIHNTEVETRAQTLAATQIATLKAQLAAPVAIDAPSLIVREPSVCSGPVGKDAGSGSATNAAAPQPAVVPRSSEASEGVDLGPEIDKRFADDDALISALQQRIEDERGVCR